MEDCERQGYEVARGRAVRDTGLPCQERPDWNLQRCLTDVFVVPCG
jgi:hypothetical protein